MKTTTRSVIDSDVIKNKLKPVNNTMTVVQTRLRVDTWMWLHEHRVWQRTLDNNRRRWLCRSVGLALLLWLSSSWQLAVLMGGFESLSWNCDFPSFSPVETDFLFYFTSGVFLAPTNLTYYKVLILMDCAFMNWEILNITDFVWV